MCLISAQSEPKETLGPRVKNVVQKKLQRWRVLNEEYTEIFKKSFDLYKYTINSFFKKYYSNNDSYLFKTTLMLTVLILHSVSTVSIFILKSPALTVSVSFIHFIVTQRNWDAVH